jgi:hypothetical protein
MHLQRVEEAETKPSLAASPAQQKPESRRPAGQAGGLSL